MDIDYFQNLETDKRMLLIEQGGRFIALNDAHISFATWLHLYTDTDADADLLLMHAYTVKQLVLEAEITLDDLTSLTSNEWDELFADPKSAIALIQAGFNKAEILTMPLTKREAFISYKEAVATFQQAGVDLSEIARIDNPWRHPLLERPTSTLSLLQASIPFSVLTTQSDEQYPAILPSAPEVAEMVKDKLVTFDEITALDPDLCGTLLWRANNLKELLKNTQLSLTDIGAWPQRTAGLLLSADPSALSDLINNKNFQLTYLNRLDQIGFSFHDWLALESEWRSEILEQAPAVRVLVQEAKIALTELTSLPSDWRSEIVMQAPNVRALVQEAKIALTDLTTLPKEERTLLLSDPKIALALIKMGFDKTEILTMPSTKRQVLIGYAEAITELQKARVSLSTIVRIADPSNSLLLQNARGTIALLQSGFSMQELLDMDKEQCSALIEHSAEVYTLITMKYASKEAITALEPAVCRELLGYGTELNLLIRFAPLSLADIAARPSLIRRELLNVRVYSVHLLLGNGHIKLTDLDTLDEVTCKKLLAKPSSAAKLAAEIPFAELISLNEELDYPDQYLQDRKSRLVRPDPTSSGAVPEPTVHCDLPTPDILPKPLGSETTQPTVDETRLGCPDSTSSGTMPEPTVHCNLPTPGILPESVGSKTTQPTEPLPEDQPSSNLLLVSLGAFLIATSLAAALWLTLTVGVLPLVLLAFATIATVGGGLIYKNCDNTFFKNFAEPDSSCRLGLGLTSSQA